MTIDYLGSLFETHPIMWTVAMLFLINVGLSGFEIVIDLLTKKQRRWKDTLANCLIFVSHQLVERLYCRFI